LQDICKGREAFLNYFRKKRSYPIAITQEFRSVRKQLSSGVLVWLWRPESKWSSCTSFEI